MMKAAKIKRIAVTAVLIFAAYLLQCTIFPALEIAGIKPNLMIIITSSIGFMRGTREGMFTGFAAGLLIDIQFGDMIGYINGVFHQTYYDEDIKFPLFLIAVSEFLYGVVIYFLMFLLRSDFDFLYYLNRIIVPEMIYTIVITLGLYPFTLFINQKLEAEEKRSASKFV